MPAKEVGETGSRRKEKMVWSKMYATQFQVIDGVACYNCCNRIALRSYVCARVYVMIEAELGPVIEYSQIGKGLPGSDF